jgi:hypothetical protein
MRTSFVTGALRDVGHTTREAGLAALRREARAGGI